jgi:hypothetical protein
MPAETGTLIRREEYHTLFSRSGDICTKHLRSVVSMICLISTTDAVWAAPSSAHYMTCQKENTYN